MKIQHPAFPEITKDVTAYASWRDAGWTVVDNKHPEPDPAPDPTPEHAEAAEPAKPRKSRRR
ncbi:hypothetical protein Bra3105_06780 [Brachybacterium halotolerans subsp. kimchii]|uniref:hypothetical protein n=1 Tax=Brachybacterium halotolerans TaxID=2795215 RepID=UPI001E53B340|nr:hypothetical protein [Brachybacterium halotolerans]UEJ84012.1 hypothetical protein Bra3105_06780 [Brachybacterium halotolerans subsp. kimchii]